MTIPQELKDSFCEGRIYHYQSRLNTKKEHWHIQVNLNPISEGYLILGVINSDIAFAKKSSFKSNFVELARSDVSILKMDSFVNCAAILQKQLIVICNAWDDGDITSTKTVLPRKYLSNIRKKIHLCKHIYSFALLSIIPVG